MSEHRTNACAYEEMDEELEILVNGYSLPEVLERLAVVARKINAAPDTACPSGTVFSEKAYNERIARALEELAI